MRKEMENNKTKKKTLPFPMQLIPSLHLSGSIAVSGVKNYLTAKLARFFWSGFHLFLFI